MSGVTCDMAMSVDGFVTGPNQSPDEPFGEGVHRRLHRWMFEEADAHADEVAAITAAGAYVMGRNMVGPGRGAWDLDWKGGGATSRRITLLCSSSPTTSARPCTWRAPRRSTSSPMAPRRCSNGRARRPARAMSQSPAAPRPSTVPCRRTDRRAAAADSPRPARGRRRAVERRAQRRARTAPPAARHRSRNAPPLPCPSLTERGIETRTLLTGTLACPSTAADGAAERYGAVTIARCDEKRRARERSLSRSQLRDWSGRPTATSAWSAPPRREQFRCDGRAGPASMRSPVLAGIIGALRAWTVAMLSALSIPCS
jgi:hypothetical protein